MKIKDERMKRVRDLEIGDTFLYSNDLYIMSLGNRFVALDNGYLVDLDDDILVTPVEVECKIVK